MTIKGCEKKRWLQHAGKTLEGTRECSGAWKVFLS